MDKNKTPEPTEDTPESTENQPVPLASESQREDNETMPRSRIQRNLEKQSKRTIALTLLGTVAIIGLLIFYGPTLIVNFSLLVGKITGREEDVEEQIADQFIAAPVLDPIHSATNSASTRITGQVTTGDQIKLYINDELTDVAKPEKDNSFVFEDVELQEGTNRIEAVAFVKDKKSNASNTITVVFLKEPPELTVDHPQDGTAFAGESTLTVRGKTDPGINVTVNGFVAITKDNGEFSHTIVLQNSENKILVIATDRAGSKTEKEIKVTYSP